MTKIELWHLMCNIGLLFSGLLFLIGFIWFILSKEIKYTNNEIKKNVDEVKKINERRYF